mmetsp:Transcript_29805/g.86480  ORF Transcript_29805/g.86480 Transcript_29805/m.86480 type:complete len:317 (-) Transcript_29805:93-1043(-)
MADTFMNCLAISPGSSFFEASQSFHTFANLWSCPLPSMSSAVMPSLPDRARVGTGTDDATAGGESDPNAPLPSEIAPGRSRLLRRSSANCFSLATLSLFASSSSSSSSVSANIPPSFCFLAVSSSSFRRLSCSNSRSLRWSSSQRRSSRSRAASSACLSCLRRASSMARRCSSSSLANTGAAGSGLPTWPCPRSALADAEARYSSACSASAGRDRSLEREPRPPSWSRGSPRSARPLSRSRSRPCASRRFFFLCLPSPLGCGGGGFGCGLAFGCLRTTSAGTIASRPTFGIRCGPAMWSVMPPFLAPRTTVPSGSV